MIPELRGFWSLISIFVEIKDLGILKYCIKPQLKGDLVHQTLLSVQAMRQLFTHCSCQELLNKLRPPLVKKMMLSALKSMA